MFLLFFTFIIMCRPSINSVCSLYNLYFKLQHTFYLFYAYIKMVNCTLKNFFCAGFRLSSIFEVEKNGLFCSQNNDLISYCRVFLYYGRWIWCWNICVDEIRYIYFLTFCFYHTNTLQIWWNRYLEDRS